MKADPNDAADAFVQRSLRGLMDIRAFKATALGRAASGYARLVQLPVAQTLDFLWFQALASVSALRNFAFKDGVTAWSEHYNAIHPGINMFSVHFANRAPWCQHVIGQSRRIKTNLPDGTEVSLALRLHGGSVKYIKDPLITHLDLVGERGFTLLPELSSIRAIPSDFVQQGPQCDSDTAGISGPQELGPRFKRHIEVGDLIVVTT